MSSSWCHYREIWTKVHLDGSDKFVLLSWVSQYISGKLSLCDIFGKVRNAEAHKSYSQFTFIRFLNGMGLGFVLSTTTIYIVEIASTDMRGVLGCFIQFMGGTKWMMQTISK